MNSITRLLIAAIAFAATATVTSAEQAPDVFKVKVETSKGNFVLEVTRKWAPIGADRFHELVKNKFYKEARFFRVVPGFMVQWGINADPEVQKNWKNATIKDDPVVASNQRGFITYAKTGLPNSRSTQLFINFGDNSFLDPQKFAPFGRVVEGMDVVEAINAEYGEKPDQTSIQTRGNEYLKEKFPNLDFIKSMRIIK